ncbi:MAG: anhydro-N-acetylmuramic acid kinase [bacterium]
MSEMYHVLGVMSGSSMDGIDLAHCRFIRNDQKGWSFAILDADTVAFDMKWLKLLNSIAGLPATDILEQDILFGRYLGQICWSFMKEHNFRPDFIASHGHTLFHRPAKGFTLQIGHGQAIASETGVPVVCDFRTKDILLGGQGAPLVPVGDEYLFDQYDICLNLGGIANLSLRQSGKRTAYDICPANQLLNHLSRQTGAPYDRGGEMASKGKLLPELYNLLNTIDYYRITPPKSLGNEDIRRIFIPLLETIPGSVEDKLHTTSQHIAHQIAVATGGLAPVGWDKEQNPTSADHSRKKDHRI